MNTNTIELNTNEMAQVNAGSGVSEFFQEVGLIWDIFNCRIGRHDYVWNYEYDKEEHMDDEHVWRYKIHVCTKCGKKIVSKEEHVIDSWVE